MTKRSTSVAVTTTALLTASALYVGGWATLAPRTFYDSFPGLHHTWISVDGPFNEHLVRDVGGLYLALAAAGLLALWWREARVFAVVGVAWTAWSVVHLAYHADHLDALDTVDAVMQLGTLAATLVLAVMLAAFCRHPTV